MIHDKYDDDEDPFDKALGLPMAVDSSHIIEHMPDVNPEQKVEIRTYIQNDYDFARKTLRALIGTGAQLFQDAAVAAQQTGTAEGYVAASQVMKNIVDANDKLLKLSETHAKVTDGKKNEIKKEKEEQQPVIENRTLVVTSTDMLSMIKNARNGTTTEE